MFNFPYGPTGNTSKTNLFSGLGDFLGGLPWGNIAKTGLSYAAVENMMDRLGDAGKAAVEGSTALGTEVREGMKFKPFTVTTGTGTVTTTPEGGYSTALGAAGREQQQGIQNIISGMLGGGRPAPYISAPQRPSASNNFKGSLGGIIPGGDNEFMPMASSADIGLNGRPTVDNTGKFINNQTGEIRYGKPTQPMFTNATPTSISDQAFGGVGGLLSAVTGDRGTREQQIYDRIRATQTPEEERQRQLLNDQLLSQGRLGLSTAMFGGSPEQFAQEKARAEAMNQASLAAMGQAGQERAQDLATATGLFGLGSQGSMLPYQLQGMQGQNLAQMMGLQYAPERQLLDSLTQGVNVAQLADLGRRSGQSLFADTGMAGLEGMLSTDMARANLIGNIYSSLLGGAGAGATQAGGGSWLGDLIGSGGSWLGEQLGKIGT
tara:strand:+ start:42 stop:1343 length:1302 start_codon:yes stop_codon:yes gene_type:complete